MPKFITIQQLIKQAGIPLRVVSNEVDHLLEQFARHDLRASALTAAQRYGSFGPELAEELAHSEGMRGALRGALHKQLGAEKAYEAIRGVALPPVSKMSFPQILELAKSKHDPAYIGALRDEILGMRKVAVHINHDDAVGLLLRSPDVGDEFSKAMTEVKLHRSLRRAAEAKAMEEVSRSVDSSFAKTMAHEAELIPRGLPRLFRT